MLEFLRIQGLALIENMELEFAPGMNVLTGETGAGKSFILKGINFLLGEKMSADMVRSGHEKAHVEGIFRHNGEELFLRRDLMADTGRSRLYVNDTLTSQDVVKELRSSLLVHTSQHGQQKLLQPTYQAQLVENALPDTTLLEKRDALLVELQKVSHERKALQAKFDSLSERRDLLEMQQQEIDKVAPELGEEDKLEAQRAEARRVSTQIADYEQALSLLHGHDGPGLIELLGTMERLLEKMSSYDESMEADCEAIGAVRQNLPALESRLRKSPEATAIDTDALESRLYALSQLKRKLHRSLEDILQLRVEIDENISFLDSCGLDLKRLEREEGEIVKKLQVTLEGLIPLRHTAAQAFTEQLERALAGLGFSKDIRVIADFSPVTLWTYADTVICDIKARLLWAPNPGQAPQPLDKIASGGELSRFLLALVSCQDLAEDATYIFDEVDAGIGGMTLTMVSDRLHDLARARQMLLITHWPQLAAHAERHFQVRKKEVRGQTTTHCQRLGAKARAAELSRMAGGNSSMSQWQLPIFSKEDE